ncbi:MAG: LysR family transcriptional regulator [Oligoflexus sp.]
MSLLTHLNLNYLRIFLVVYRTRSMTQAAKELHLTQSGVSQQIKSLEETLNITLFDRVNRRIIPTSEAEILYRECSRRLDDLERALRQISNQDKELFGTVKLGAPAIFGQQILAPLLSQFATENPLVNFELVMGLASEMTELLLKGKLDFAFLDAHSTDPHLLSQEINEQSLLMVCPEAFRERLSSDSLDYASFAKLPFISYTDNLAMLKAWFQSNFEQTPHEIFVRVTTEDCHMALKFVQHGVGAALLPVSLIEELTRNGQDSDFFLEEQKPFKNVISVCRLAKRTMGLTADRCYSWLLQELHTDH